MADITHGTWIKDGKAVDKVFSNGQRIYGRNLLLGTKTPLLLAVNGGYGVADYALSPKYQGGKVTLSFDMELKGITDFNVKNGPTMRVLFDTGWGNDNTTYETAPNYPVDKRWVVTKIDATHWHMSITVNAIYDEQNGIPNQIRFFYVLAPGGTTTGYIVSKAMLTAGTSTLPYSIAPEDILN
ncbi:hypothetical protein JWR93_03825 [Lactiplantibacillus plantarum]|nr:hypothetical protein JWR93_03825 [Lactiplantibacillus plantarum]